MLRSTEVHPEFFWFVDFPGVLNRNNCSLVYDQEGTLNYSTACVVMSVSVLVSVSLILIRGSVGNYLPVWEVDQNPTGCEVT